MGAMSEDGRPFQYGDEARTGEDGAARKLLNNKPAWMTHGVGVNKDFFGFAIAADAPPTAPAVTAATAPRDAKSDPWAEVFAEQTSASKVSDGDDANGALASASGVLADASEAGANAQTHAEGRKRPRLLALDCEMVGVGPRGKKSVLARISVVGRGGRMVMDCLVRPEKEVTDWRTAITGINASSFSDPRSPGPLRLPKRVLSREDAVAEANKLLDSAVIVGHDMRHDFKLLRRFHQRHALVRDTAFYPLLAAGLEGKRRGRGCGAGLPSLRALAGEWLEQSLHGGRAHDSVEDARTAMLLYRLVAAEWEAYAAKKFGPPPPEVLEECAVRPARRRGRRRARNSGRPRGIARLRMLQRLLRKRSPRLCPPQ